MLKGSKKFLAAILIIIIINLSFLLVWIYLYLKINDRNNHILEIKKEIISIKENLNNIESLEKLLASISIEKDIINSVFLEKDNIVEFIEQLESLAEETNVLLELTSGDTSKFNLTLYGEFKDIFRYITLLENMTYWISLESLDIKEQMKKVGPWQADIEVLLTSFLSKNENKKF